MLSPGGENIMPQAMTSWVAAQGRKVLLFQVYGAAIPEDRPVFFNGMEGNAFANETLAQGDHDHFPVGVINDRLRVFAAINAERARLMRCRQPLVLLVKLS